MLHRLSICLDMFVPRHLWVSTRIHSNSVYTHARAHSLTVFVHIWKERWFTPSLLLPLCLVSTLVNPHTPNRFSDSVPHTTRVYSDINCSRYIHMHWHELQSTHWGKHNSVLLYGVHTHIHDKVADGLLQSEWENIDIYIGIDRWIDLQHSWESWCLTSFNVMLCVWFLWSDWLTFSSPT